MYDITSPVMLRRIKKYHLEETVEQIYRAAKNSVYIMGTYRLDPVRKLLHHMKRNDICLVNPNVDLRQFRGRHMIYDHTYLKYRA